MDVAESAATMEENAVLKAKQFATLSGILTLADDSGLEVEALGGEPGVKSRRFAGENATDEERIKALLKRMEGVPVGNRGARFRCVIAIVQPDGQIYTCEGICQGVISLQPAGDSGFGYDPIFFLPQVGRTMAELTMKQKNRLSHRGIAAGKAYKLLLELYERFKSQE